MITQTTMQRPWFRFGRRWDVRLPRTWRMSGDRRHDRYGGGHSGFDPRGHHRHRGEGRGEFDPRFDPRGRRGEGPVEFGHGRHGEGRGEFGHGHRGEGRGEFDPRFDPRRRQRGPGDGGGPRVGRGDVRTAILLLLSEQPSHGYQIIQQVSERTGGIWQPSPGSVYPALQLLEDEDLVRAEQNEGRRVFHLTDAGRAYVEAHREELNAAWKAVTETVDNRGMEVHVLLGQVGKALHQVLHEGTVAQIAAARELMANTRRQLYRILAEDETPGNTDSSSDRPSS